MYHTECTFNISSKLVLQLTFETWF